MNNCIFLVLTVNIIIFTSWAHLVFHVTFSLLILLLPAFFLFAINFMLYIFHLYFQTCYHSILDVSAVPKKFGFEFQFFFLKTISEMSILFS